MKTMKKLIVVLVITALLVPTSALADLWYLTGEENVRPDHGTPDRHIAALNISEHIDNDLTLQEKIDAINAQDGYAILAHPNMPGFTYSVPELLSLTDYFGIEIFNGYCESVAGKGFAENKWHQILTSGRKVWGFGVDDAHTTAQRGYGYSMGNFTNDETWKDCMEEGDFYVSAKSKFTYLSFNPSLKRITVRTNKTSWIKYYGKNGTKYGQHYGTEHSYYMTGNEGYIVVKLANADGRAWTQPFWIEDDGSVTSPYHASQLPTKKFNTHCHGSFDSTYDWYYDHNFKGLVITNYNRITDLMFHICE